MNTNTRYAVLAVLIAGILFVLASLLSGSLLYTLATNAFPSGFHDDVDVLKLQSLNTTTDLLPQLQDIIDFSGPISLSIQIHDIAQARRDLDRFAKSQGLLKNLIVTLDMNQSEIQEIETDTAMQKQILETLENTTSSLDSLQQLEIQYHGQNNNDMLTTVRLQGDAIRQKVRGLDERYRNSTQRLMTVATKFGLDVTKTQESQKTVDQITGEIVQPKAKTLISVNTTLTPGDERISLFVNPDSGKYRDVINYMGLSLTLNGNTTLRADNSTITLYIDDNPVSTATTDSFGYYSMKLPIARIAEGNHTVYSQAPTSRSVKRDLTVIAVDSVTNLTLSKPDPDGNVNCTGSVMANYPVGSASVQISWDDSHVLITKTNANGEFMQDIHLGPGIHTIVASFSGDGYPINPSQSDPAVVEISLIRGVEMDYGRIALIISAIGIFLLFLAAAMFYLRRMGQRKIPVANAGTDALSLADLEEELFGNIAARGKKPAPGEPTKLDDETLIGYYTRMLRVQGLSAASRNVYQQVSGRVARDLRIKRHKTLTPREMSKTCKGKPYCGAFARFVAVYEGIRYGGKVSVKDQTVFETALDSTEEQMEREDH